MTATQEKAGAWQGYTHCKKCYEPLRKRTEGGWPVCLCCGHEHY